MKTLISILSFCIFSNLSFAQLITTPSGGNKKAIVSESIGLTQVTIDYSRPGVKGREGKIWGSLIHKGFIDQNFGPSKASPWRAGANENTTIEFTTPVKIEGKDLDAGKYGFFVAYDSLDCTLIFSKNNSSWGSYYYNEKEDALRVKVKPLLNNTSIEWLKYEFANQKDDNATVQLMWEKLIIPFKVEVDLKKTQVESFRKELRNEKSYFSWHPWQQAAQWCVTNNYNLEEGLLWADTSINPNVLGERNFQTLSTKAQILQKLNRIDEASNIMKEALPMGNMNQIHNYARELLKQKRNKDALEVFQLNFKKYPNTFTTYMGLARGFNATNDFKQALENAIKASEIAPDNNSKNFAEQLILQLKQSKDIN